MKPNADLTSAASALPELTLPPSFPAGAYTPHGYLASPGHDGTLGRLGVVRSVPPLGCGFWRRTFKGCGGDGPRDRINYLSILKLTLAYDQTRLVSAADFPQAGIDLVSRYHTSHLLSYDFEHNGLTFALRFFLPRPDVLACLVEVHNVGLGAIEVFLHANHVFGLWEQPWTGADGVGMHYVPERDACVSAIWTGGEYFAVGGHVHSVAQKATATRGEVPRWLRGNDLTSRQRVSVPGRGPLHTIMTYKLMVPADGRASVLVGLAHGATEPAALTTLDAALGDGLAALEQQLDHDEAFWAHCPQLDGDWPASWKRGWVYDWETLRLNTRSPAGAFSRPWPGGQVHTPVCDLGTAALELLTLAQADAPLAQEALLGILADAQGPQVPPVSAAGALRLIGPDAATCGRAPSVGLLFRVLRSLYALRPDPAWAAELYPHVQRYVEWWLAHRADQSGRFFCTATGELGPAAARFGRAAEADLSDLRPVDVQAALADGLQCLAWLAQVADAPLDVPRWQGLAQQAAAHVEHAFIDGTFRDVAAHTGEPLRHDELDASLLVPLACGLATEAQAAAVTPALARLAERALAQPAAFHVLAEAAGRAGQRELLAEAVAGIAERVYPRLDTRTVLWDEPDKPFAYRVPGVACEWWPVATDTEPGTEACAAGATLPLHFIRGLLGLREADAQDLPVATDDDLAEFQLAPTLPARLRTPGRSYAVRNLSFAGVSFVLRMTTQAADRLQIALEYTLATPGNLYVCDAQGHVLTAGPPAAHSGTVEFAAGNGQCFRLRVARRA